MGVAFIWKVWYGEEVIDDGSYIRDFAVMVSVANKQYFMSALAMV